MRRRQRRREWECLEARRLLAGDVVARWLADDLVSEVDGSIPVWIDTHAGTEAHSSGSPTLVPNSIGGRSVVRLDPSDDVDFFTVDGNAHRLPNGRFSVVVAFATQTAGQGDPVTWFSSSGLVDANTLGIGHGWGISFSANGTVAAGLGDGFGNPPTTIHSDSHGLHDGQLHVVTFTRDAGTISLYLDDQLASQSTTASIVDRDRQPITFGIANGRNIPFAGDIAEIRFYDDALTLTEVTGVHSEISAYFNNSPPEAKDDRFEFQEDVSLGFISADQGVLQNDIDPDNDPLTAELVETTTNGSLSLLPDGSFVYSPTPNFFGTDSFTYVARDSRASEIATVTLNVLNTYDAATAVDDHYTLLPDEVATIGFDNGILANDVNLDRVPLTAVVDAHVGAGQLTLSGNGAFEFDPQGFAGVTEFSYRIDDGTQLSDPARVTLLVNSQPVVQDDQYLATEDLPLAVASHLGVLANDFDAERNSLLVTLVEQPQHGLLTLEADGSFVYSPHEDFHGRDTFRYQVSDSFESSPIATVAIEVEATNDAPVASPDVYFVGVDTQLAISPETGVLANDIDIDSQVLRAVLDTPPRHGSVVLNDDGSFVYESTSGFEGIDTFAYRAIDDELASNEVAVQLYVGTSPARISELSAANITGLETKVRAAEEDDFPRDSMTPDWIELTNITEGEIDLGGFYLSDDRSNPTKWQIPMGATIPPGGFRLFFASGKNIVDPQRDESQSLHTNFSLNMRGEEVILAYPDGRVAHEMAFPLQYPDRSFGMADDQATYLMAPTPGEPNQMAAAAVSPIEFSVPRGMYEAPFSLSLTTTTDGAQIRYTIDGTAPSADHGLVYEGPLQIATTTTLRAIALLDGHLPSEIQTHSYLFLSDVIQQPEMIEGYPDSWAGMPADYGMDSDVVGTDNLFDDLYRNTVFDDLKSLPTLSLVFDPDDMFGRRGLYQNPTATGDRWERPTSVEFFDPHGGEPGFHLHSGIRIMGGSSRQPDIPKHSFRLEFREQYGWGKLDYPLFADAPFGDQATRSFDELVIRVGFNNSWMHRHYYQSERGEQPRDQWVRDLQFAMGHHSTRGRFAHIYLNGLYWGIYNLQERPAAPFMEDYFGGDQDTEWDVISSGSAIDGSARSWNTAHRDVRDVTDAESFEAFKDKVDVVNLADYMLLNFYVGNTDWDGHNWIAAAKQDEPYKFYAWDSEFAISLPPSNAALGENAERQIINTDKTRQNSVNNPSGLHQRLMRNDEYKMLFADRVQKHMFNGGALTPEVATQLFLARSAEIDRAVVAESARWGDFRRDVNPGRWQSRQFDLYHRDEHYVNQKEFIVDRYLPVRTDIVLAQLRRGRALPSIDAPSFNQHGGRVPVGFELSISAPDDVTVYFTLDGQDPREPGGGVRATALAYQTPLALTDNVVVKARSLQDGEWSALSEAQFNAAVPASAENLRISEVHYHPAAPSQTEIAAGYNDADEFEFIELTNISDRPIDISDVRFVQVPQGNQTQGVQFDFYESSLHQLQPSEFVVVAENVDAFRFRYGSAIPLAGQWVGGLSNAGEAIKLVAGAATIQEFVYDDAWYPTTDGAGPSLVAAALETTDPTVWNVRAGWRPSHRVGGSPGSAESLAGDVNHDGVFNSSDLVLVFQAAEYEDGIPLNSSFEEGDWNGDGEFTSADLVFAFRQSHFQADAVTEVAFDDPTWIMATIRAKSSKS